MGTYNRLAAVNYAIQFALSRNKAFPSYSSSDGGHGGGDCTNFVSQCLLMGGWTMRDGFKHNPMVWYLTSNTWGSAQWFDWFLRFGGRARRCEREELALGDVVMYQAPDFNNPDHAMIVTRLSDDDVYVSYHSMNQLHHPLSEIETRLGSETKFFYWKILDVFDGPPSDFVLTGYFAT